MVEIDLDKSTGNPETQRITLAGGSATLELGNNIVLTLDLNGPKRFEHSLPQRGMGEIDLERAPTVESHLTGPLVETNPGD